jgi:hypothetical protein
MHCNINKLDNLNLDVFEENGKEAITKLINRRYKQGMI